MGPITCDNRRKKEERDVEGGVGKNETRAVSANKIRLIIVIYKEK